MAYGESALSFSPSHFPFHLFPPLGAWEAAQAPPPRSSVVAAQGGPASDGPMVWSRCSSPHAPPGSPSCSSTSSTYHGHGCSSAKLPWPYLPSVALSLLSSFPLLSIYIPSLSVARSEGSGSGGGGELERVGSTNLRGSMGWRCHHPAPRTSSLLDSPLAMRTGGLLFFRSLAPPSNLPQWGPLTSSGTQATGSAGARVDRIQWRAGGLVTRARRRPR
jgi:hypothetical protein